MLRFKEQLFELFLLFSLAGQDLGAELGSLLEIFVLEALLPGQVRSPGFTTCQLLLLGFLNGHGLRRTLSPVLSLAGCLGFSILLHVKPLLLT